MNAPIATRWRWPRWVQRMVRRLVEPAPRLQVQCVPYSEADALLRRGWQLAPEEDTNRKIGWVILELPAREMTGDERKLVLGALDSLAVALADHGHTWSDGERAIYEQSVAIVRGETWRDDEAA